MKSEPDVFSIDQLKREKSSLWDGVRNYQARNFMRDQMQVGDQILFYHSNATPPGLAGLAKVVKSAVPDPTQFNKKSEYYDPKATPEAPRWMCVKVGFVKKFPRYIPLDELKATKALKSMLVVQKGQRLSIQPVTKSQFDHVLKMADKTV